MQTDDVARRSERAELGDTSSGQGRSAHPEGDAHAATTTHTAAHTGPQQRKKRRHGTERKDEEGAPGRRMELPEGGLEMRGEEDYYELWYRVQDWAVQGGWALKISGGPQPNKFVKCCLEGRNPEGGGRARRRGALQRTECPFAAMLIRRSAEPAHWAFEFRRNRHNHPPRRAWHEERREQLRDRIDELHRRGVAACEGEDEVESRRILDAVEAALNPAGGP